MSRVTLLRLAAAFCFLAVALGAFGAHAFEPTDDYPDYVIPLGRALVAGTVERGLALCGSGVGIAVCANKIPTKSWVKTGMAIQWAAFAAAAGVVVFYGVYGYFVESIIRIGFSVYQVLAVLAAIVLVMAIDIPMFKGARTTGQIRWGTEATQHDTYRNRDLLPLASDKGGYRLTTR